MRIASALILLAGCAAGRESATPTAPATKPQVRAATTAEDPNPPPRDERFVPALRQAAAAYRGWGRVDERPNLAPTRCRMPTPADYGSPSQVRMSAATASPHGEKLYYLWASSGSDYARLGTVGGVPVGFAIVKESFVASDHASEPRIDVTAQISVGLNSAPAPIDSLETQRGRRYVGAPTGLYIMTKVAADGADGTDAGWVYGTITPDGEVTSAGRVEQCMACHEDTDHDRLFGLRPPT